MIKSYLVGAACACTCTLLTNSLNAALIDNGGGLIYDTVLDITWAQPDVVRNWDDANTWAAGLTLGGVDEWRLPYISVAAGDGPSTTTPINCNGGGVTEVDCRDNELGYMFYYNLGGTVNNSILTSGDPDLDLFPTLQAGTYWSGTENVSNLAWVFLFNNGVSGIDSTSANHYSWAVHAGNVGAVPVPAAVWLFGSGLLGLIGIARRKKAA